MNHFLFDKKTIEDLEGIEKKKQLQQIRVVKLLYIEGPQTTAKLCKKLKISAPNMTTILNELTKNSIVEKKGQGKSIGGRRPDLYGVSSDSFFVIAVDMGIFKTQISIFNANNKKIEETKQYSILLNNEKSTLDSIIESIQSFISESSIETDKILGVGISLPGLVDSENGINHTYLNFKEGSLVELLQQNIGLPIFIENDAKAMALAEFHFGSARNKKNVLVMYLDWGIGLGMILDGKLYRGTSGLAGEFAHIPMVENGQLCRCGKLGCLETIASGITILEKAEEGVKEKKTSILLGNHSDDQKFLELKNVILAALNGDQYAIKILDETGKYLGKGISILIQLLNPELIVVCGKLAESGELITTPIQQGINTHAMKQISEHTEIKISEFGNEISIFGGLAVVMENLFDYFLY